MLIFSKKNRISRNYGYQKDLQGTGFLPNSKARNSKKDPSRSRNIERKKQYLGRFVSSVLAAAKCTFTRVRPFNLWSWRVSKVLSEAENENMSTMPSRKESV
jgi:hypothetical protein